MTTEMDINHPATTIVVTAGASLAMAILLLAPGMIGGMITMLHFSPKQAGLIITAELGAVSTTAIITAFWLHDVNWHRVVTISICLAAIGNVLSYKSTSFEELFTARLLTGAVSGVLTAIIIATLGMMRDPDRSFGYWFGGQLLFGAIGLACLPNIFSFGGFNAVYLILSFFLGILLVTVRYYPVHPSVMEKLTQAWPSPAGAIIVIGLAIPFFNQAGIFGVWAYFERIGDAAGLTVTSIAYSLSLSTLFGIVGSLAAGIVTTRWGRIAPVVVGTCLSIFAIFLVMYPTYELFYTLAAVLFSFSWYFTLPYLLASLASADPGGRLLVWGNSAASYGIAAGPVIAGGFQSGNSFHGVLWFGIISIAIGFIFVIKLHHEHTKPHRHRD